MSQKKQKKPQLNEVYKKRKPLKNLNEVFKHTEMPQKFYGNASKKRGNATTK